MDKKRELRKLNLVHLKQQQKERRLKKVENEQRNLHEKLMEELMEELKTNPKWKAHLMKVYREMYNTGRERYEQRKSSYAFYRISRLTKTVEKTRTKFTPSVCKITEGAGTVIKILIEN
jgi:transposase